jgi:hypothetical protein
METDPKAIPEEIESMSLVEAKAFEEGSKLFHDTFKHLTTLSTGSILLLVTFFDKFKLLQWKFLATLSLVAFIVSTLVSFLLMLFLAKDVSIMGKPTSRDWLFRWGAWVAAVSFVLGLIILVFFAANNFSSWMPSKG